MAFPYNTISTNVDSLNTGSFYYQLDLDNFLSGSNVDKYFGASEQDIIEFSVYNIDENLQIWSTLPTNPIYNVITKTYKDVDQNILTYNYKQYSNGYVISFNKKILLDTLNDLSSSAIVNGNHVISYNCLRNIGGTPEYPMIIKNVSVSRNEVQLVPSFKIDSNDELQKIINLELTAFAQKKFLIRDIIPVMVKQLDNYEIYSQSNELISNNSKIFDLMRTTFGFITNVDVINFLNEIYVGFTKPIQGNDNQIIYDIFEGISGYLKDWLYTYYQNIESANELQIKFQYIINKATEIRLRKVNTFFGTNKINQALITNFITNIFYDNFIKNVISQIDTDYKNKYFGYLQNALNFGNNTFIPILNYEGYIENGVVNIIVKTMDYLPKSIGLRDRCWISNISLKPLLQKFIINSAVVKKSFKIAGPNFKIKINDYKTNPVDYQSSKDLKLSDNESTQVQFYKKLTELNVDYADFSNFILFSSAELRIKLFLNKQSKLNTLNTKLLQYQNASISASVALSSSYAMDCNSIQKQINNIYNGFDGYEVYLNALPSGSLSGDALTSYLSDAVEYDIDNKDSLINNTPSYVVNDGDNSDYLIFLSMIGHHFDNLWLYFNKFPTLQYVDSINFPTDDDALSNTSASYLSSFANVLLEQFGWNPISSFDSSTISQTFLTGSNNVSDDQKLKTIWNRILKNLPILYKTKGTEECVRLLANIYGIPNYLLNIKEFGGNNIYAEDKSSYTFDQIYYLTKFSGGKDTLVLPAPNPVNSIEFKLKFDPDKIYPQNTEITFAGSTFWRIYVIKTEQKYCGKIVFTFLQNDFIIDNIPIFNGKIYNILLKCSIASDFDSGIELLDIPAFITFRVTSIEDDRILFDVAKKRLFIGFDADNFRSIGYLYLGNYSSYTGFNGSIDKVNIWAEELSDEAFLDHARNFEGFNNYTSSTTYQNLWYRYSVDYPINLYTGSGVRYINNVNKYYSNLSGSVYYFPQNTMSIVNCVETSASVFPYQFEELHIKQNIKLDNAGPNKYKNTKINKVTETAVARLMPTERSVVSNTILQDSNLIGVYISPFKVRDDDITNFLGNYNLMDSIGGPDELYSVEYDNLRQLRNDYNTKNLAEKVLYQEFLTLYKHYFDGSFFTTTRQLFPARTKIIDGILIEPTIIERSKYQNRPIDSALSADLTASAFPKSYGVTGSNIEMLYDNIILDISKNGHESIENNKNFTGNYISDDIVEKRRSIYVTNGNYTDRDFTGSLKNYIAYNFTEEETIIGDFTNYTREFISYNFNLSGSITASCDFVDRIPYPKGHFSTLNRPLRSFSVKGVDYTTNSSSLFIKSQQTIYTTVNDKGILDGSSPVQITNVDKDRNQNSLTTS